ncbi:MCP four helix bundle domain-containing protein, partial [Plantactinospora endophytica]
MAEDYIPRLWRLVDAARQRLQPSRDQVAAWERASSMLGGHASRLQDCRNQLAGLWPPEQNAASAAYMVELDRLIEASRQTSTAAQNNATHIGHVADAIEQARTKLEPIYNEYLENQRKLADYQRQVELAGDVGGVVGGAAGSRFGLTALGQKAGDFLGEGAMTLLTDPPVSDAQQAALVARARAVQVEMDGAARDGGGRIQPPPEYLPPPVPRGDDARQFDDDSDGTVRPPVVNPPPRRRAEAEREESRPGFIEGTPPPDLHTELTPEQVTPPRYPVDDGPTLTGVAPPTTAPPPPVAPVPPGPPVGAPPPVSPVVPPTIGVPPPLGGPPGTGPGLGGVPRSTGAPGKVPGFGPAATTGVPPGGVIGARPGGGVAVPPGGVGAPRAGGVPRGINPVGGVIGPPGASG